MDPKPILNNRYINICMNSLEQDIAFFNSKQCSTELAQKKSSTCHSREDIYVLCKKYNINRYATKKDPVSSVKSRLKTIDELCQDIKHKFMELKNQTSKQIDLKFNLKVDNLPVKTKELKDILKSEGQTTVQSIVQNAGNIPLKPREKVIHGFILGDLLFNDTLKNSKLLYQTFQFNPKTFELYNYQWLIVSLKKNFDVRKFPTEVIPSVLLYTFLIQSFSELSSNGMNIKDEINDIGNRFHTLSFSYIEDPNLIFLQNQKYAKEMMNTEYGHDLIMTVLYAVYKFIMNMKDSVLKQDCSSTSLLLWINDLDLSNSAIGPLIFAIWAGINPKFEMDENYLQLKQQIVHISKKIL